MSSEEFIMEYLPSSESVWSFFSWLGLAYLQFFILQFVADTRSRDIIVRKASHHMSISFYMQSILHFILLFLWASAAWAVWLKGAWNTHTFTLIGYVVLLFVELLAWIALWGKFALRIAAGFMLINTIIAFVLLFYSFSLTGSALLLLPYAIWQFVQTINFHRFAKSNTGVTFPKRSFGRLRESSKRINANEFFNTLQSPTEHIVKSHEEAPPNAYHSAKPDLKIGDNNDFDFDLLLDEELP